MFNRLLSLLEDAARKLGDCNVESWLSGGLLYRVRFCVKFEGILTVKAEG